MIKVGIIGYNSIAQSHINCYRHIKGVQVTQIADSSEKRLAQAKNNEQYQNYFQDYHRLLESPDIDLVDICTQSGINPQLCLEIADSKKSFLVEPPFAFTVQEAKEIRDTVNKNRVKACIAYPYRFKPSIAPFVKKYQLEEFGKVFSIFVTAFEPSPRMNSKIAPIFKLPSAIDALTLFGGNVKSILAKSPTFFDDPIGLLEPEIRAFIEFENNCTGFLTWSAYAPVYDFTIQVYGTGFAVRMNTITPSNEVLNWWWEPKSRLSALKEVSAGFRSFFRRQHSALDSGYFPMISEFLNSIETDTQSPVPFDDGIKTMALIEGIHKSIEAETEIRIKSF